VDFYTNLTFKVQKGRGLWSRDPISKFWDPPYNFGMNRDGCFKFGTDIEDGPLLRMDNKTTPKWAWPGHVTKFQNLGPLITFERIELFASNLAQT